jgi:RNA polymerase sigma factor (sigma-70 family)
LSFVDRLLARARNGDKQAEKEIFQRLFVRFRVLAKRTFEDDEDCKDVAQEACITVLDKYKTEEFSTSFEAWAYGVLKMKIGNFVQSAAVRRRRLTSNIDTARDQELASNPPDHELRRRLIDCLKRILDIQPRFARILNLIHHGYDTDEISRRLKVKPDHTYVMLHRGRSLLKSCLETGRV